MRHQKQGRRLGMPGDRRRALMRGLMAQLMRYEHIKTTEARAKELRPRFERLITLGKRGDLHARRLALSYLPDKLMVEKLFADVAPRYAGSKRRVHPHLEDRTSQGRRCRDGPNRVGLSSRRVRATVEYHGGAYVGFQSQPSLPNVQRTIEDAVTAVSNAPARIVAAGRTDSGAHACGQVIAFDVDTRLDDEQLLRAVNAHLPADVAFRNLATTSSDFHPRFDAISREYHYLILNRPTPSPFWRDRAFHLASPLDINAMTLASKELIGEHDFGSFVTGADETNGENRSRVRKLSVIDIERDGELVRFRLIGNGFMHHMVRSIVGTLVQVGVGRMQPQQITTILAARDRSLAASPVPAYGLYLMNVNYEASKA